jgi:hypothetical protein
MFLISCSRLHLISLKCESVWSGRPSPFFPADMRLEQLADPNKCLEGECMAAQKITRLRHESNTVEIGCRDAGSCIHPPQFETDGHGMSRTL